MKIAPTLVVLGLLTACAGEPSALPGPTEVSAGPDATLAVEWNRLVLDLAEREDRFLTLKGVRTAAMTHLAMHDALNAIDRRFTAFACRAAAPSARPRRAAARAAFEVAVSQYPGRRRELEELLARTAPQPEADALGSLVAERILATREGDGWDREAEYTWHPMGPGVYAEFHEHSGTPQGFVFGAGWARARPFFLERADAFRSPPPPSIDSDEYTDAFQEVKEVGRHDSPTRTADQSHLAMWWKDFVESSHNRLARRLAVREGLDLWQAARMFALLNGCVFDAYVNVFDNKFHYNHWRPYTAIRWAEHDGNPGTEPDTTWDNLHHHTYAFPSYPSAHGCASAAAMRVLEDSLGPETPFEMFTPRVDRAGPLSEKVEMHPPSRAFSSFREAAMECALSRVYLGIHFRYDSVEGHALGLRVGECGVEGFLTPAG